MKKSLYTLFFAILATLLFTGGYIRVPRNFSAVGWDLSGNTILQYKCNDNAANTAVTDDGSGATNGTSSTNTSNMSVAGKINEAFDFTAASSEYVDCNQTLQAVYRAPFSIAVWAQPDDGQPAATQVLFGGKNAAGDRVSIQIETTGKVQVYYGESTTVIAETNVAVFPDGATSMTHIVATFSATIITIFVDSVAVALDVTNDGDMTGETMANYTSLENQFFGAFNNEGAGAVVHFDGIQDDLRVMDKELTQVEIDGIYNSGTGTESQSGN
ncbi:MAG: hypothetical protein KAR42_14865 [candidate division Zixibacteria bacterium]|nr:hypothetical protein [candidate division Zixibacteria bacterium]